jgi:hypothetical protein
MKSIDAAMGMTALVLGIAICASSCTTLPTQVHTKIVNMNMAAESGFASFCSSTLEEIGGSGSMAISVSRIKDGIEEKAADNQGAGSFFGTSQDVLELKIACPPGANVFVVHHLSLHERVTVKVEAGRTSYVGVSQIILSGGRYSIGVLAGERPLPDTLSGDPDDYLWALSDPDWATRFFAIKLLAAAKDGPTPAAVERLRAMASGDGSIRVREAAQAALR